MATIELVDGIYVMYVPTFLTVDIALSMEACLDRVEAHQGPTALIVTSKNPKIFSAGMNLKVISQNGIRSGIKIAQELMRLCGRLLQFGVPTIGAINGHAVAAGLLFALSLDYRVMNQEHGILKMTEVNLGMVIPKGGSAVLAAKVHPCIHRDMILKGREFNAQEALEAKIVDYIVPGDQVMSKAFQIAKEVMNFGENKKVYKLLKYSTYYDTIKISSAGEYSDEFVDAMTFAKRPSI